MESNMRRIRELTEKLSLENSAPIIDIDQLYIMISGLRCQLDDAHVCIKRVEAGIENIMTEKSVPIMMEIAHESK